MTAFERVSTTKRSLGLIVGSSALFWGAAAGVGLWIIGALLAYSVALPEVVLMLLPVIAIVGGLGTLAYMLWRGRFAWSFDKVALWIEEKAPQLRYALVTAIDPRYKESASILEPVVSKVDTGPFVRDAAKKSVLPALLACVVTVAILAFLPDGVKTGFGGKNIFGLGDKINEELGNRLVPLTGTLTPPAYAGRSVEQLEEPTTIMGLQGSMLVLTGKGPPDGIEITQTTPQGDRDIIVQLPVTAGGNGWTLTLPMNDSLPSMLTFKDRQYTRPPVIVNPIVDQPPTAKLLLPVRDTTLRLKDGKLPGTLNLSTDLRDDIGLSHAYYYVEIAEGGGGGQDANFEFRDTIIGRRTLSGNSAKLELSIPYSVFRLKEGNQLFVRAEVFDNNGFAVKPGKGVSETRVIRVATSGEYDTLNVNPAPPSADTALMTLRMLIIATQKLDSQKHKMERKPFVDSAYKLGGASDKVRQVIMRIIDEQTGGGEIDADPRLTEAADSMWSASRSLYIAETGEALPAMKRAYKLIQDYTNTARYYLRGILKPEPVNIDRVRLSGKDSAIAATERIARGLADVDKMRMAQAYALALRTLATDRNAAIEQLSLLQVDALRKNTALATALGDAVGAIQQDKDPSEPLLRARRFLEGKAGTLTTLPSWSGAW